MAQWPIIMALRGAEQGVLAYKSNANTHTNTGEKVATVAAQFGNKCSQLNNDVSPSPSPPPSHPTQHQNPIIRFAHRYLLCMPVGPPNTQQKKNTRTHQPQRWPGVRQRVRIRV